MSRAPTLQAVDQPRWKDDPTPWLVNIHPNMSKTGKRVRLRFPSRLPAHQFLAEHRKWLADYQSKEITLTRDDMRDAVEALRMGRPFGATLTEAMDGHVARLQAHAASITLSDLVAALLEDRARKGKRKRYLQDLRNRLERWANTYPAKKVSEVTPAGIEAWLKGRGLGPVVWNNDRRVIGVALSYAVKLGKLDVNPMNRVDIATVEDGHVEILTVDQCRRLLITAHNTPAMPIVLLGMFAGIRPAEIHRLEWSDVNPGQIKVGGTKSKTASTGFVTVQPCLFKWLEPWSEKPKGPVVPKPHHARVALESSREIAEIARWPHDALRRTFASMHLAAYENADLTAREMRHRGTAMLFRHYRGLVEKAEAMEFWNLTPGKVLP